MNRHKHDWKDVGQTYTGGLPTRTAIDWCRGCGSLKYRRSAWDYREWTVRARGSGGSTRTKAEMENALRRCGRTVARLEAWRRKCSVRRCLPIPKCWLGGSSCLPQECSTHQVLRWALKRR